MKRYIFVFVFLLFPCHYACSLSPSQGLTFTSAHVLVRALIDGPGLPPTNTKDHTLCSPCSDTHFWPCYHHTCHREERGQSPVARTCSRTWIFVLALPRPGAPFTSKQHRGWFVPATWLSSMRVKTRDFRPAWRQPIIHNNYFEHGALILSPAVRVLSVLCSDGPRCTCVQNFDV